jgi:hypothetical protein
LQIFWAVNSVKNIPEQRSICSFLGGHTTDVAWPYSHLRLPLVNANETHFQNDNTTLEIACPQTFAKLF